MRAVAGIVAVGAAVQCVEDWGGGGGGGWVLSAKVKDWSGVCGGLWLGGALALGFMHLDGE